jgi:hypothetical protein
MGKGWRKDKKRGTKNTNQATARDIRAAEAEIQALAAAEAATESPIPEVASPVPYEPTYVPSRGQLQSHKRVAIVYKYEQLGCPPESEWGKHGGTLRQIADHLDMPDPCDYRPIREVLQRHLAGEDVQYSKGGQGRKTKLGRGEQLIAADCLRSGTGQEHKQRTS